jgi:hypothetical protein
MVIVCDAKAIVLSVVYAIDPRKPGAITKNNQSARSFKSIA